MLRNEAPLALPRHRREKHLATAALSLYPFLLATASVARAAAADKTQSARRNVQSVCAHYKFIIRKRFPHTSGVPGPWAWARKAASESPLSSSSSPLPVYSSPSSHLLLQNPSQRGASRRTVDAGAFFSGAPIYCLSAGRHNVQPCEYTGWGPAFARHIVFVLGLRDAFWLIHCTGCVVQSRRERADLVRRAALAPALSHAGCRARRPPVTLLYLLNNACKHSGNALSSRSIVVISHVGSLPPFAFSSSAAVAGATRREQQRTHLKQVN